jgi:nitrite reductase (NADH) small subunit
VSAAASSCTAAPVRWYRVASVNDVPRLGARVVSVEEISIALFRTSNDTIFALQDRCPHKGGPLSQGIVHGSCVTCPLHDWVVDLESGEARGPDEGRTPGFPVRVVGEEILIGISAVP